MQAQSTPCVEGSSERGSWGHGGGSPEKLGVWDRAAEEGEDPAGELKAVVFTPTALGSPSLALCRRPR